MPFRFAFSPVMTLSDVVSSTTARKNRLSTKTHINLFHR